MIKTSIITPVWNRVDLTSQYLFSHSGQYARRKDIEWIIINNGSDDGTAQALEYWQNILVDRLIVIHNETNEGYSKANNAGAKIARGNILAFLNNDIIVQGDYLRLIEQALADDPKAIVGAQLVDFDTGWNRFGDELITYLIGWCFAMTRQTFEAIGGFDERYTPADYEDSDLCYAATRKGYELKQLSLPLQHLGNQTGKLLEDRRRIAEANRVKFAEKWGLILQIHI